MVIRKEDDFVSDVYHAIGKLRCVWNTLRSQRQRRWWEDDIKM